MLIRHIGTWFSGKLAALREWLDSILKVFSNLQYSINSMNAGLDNNDLQNPKNIPATLIISINSLDAPKDSCF